jgi:hypothetical protein
MLEVIGKKEYFEWLDRGISDRLSIIDSYLREVEGSKFE